MRFDKSNFQEMLDTVHLHDAEIQSIYYGGCEGIIIVCNNDDNAFSDLQADSRYDGPFSTTLVFNDVIYFDHTNCGTWWPNMSIFDFDFVDANELLAKFSCLKKEGLSSAREMQYVTSLPLVAFMIIFGIGDVLRVLCTSIEVNQVPRGTKV